VTEIMGGILATKPFFLEYTLVGRIYQHTIARYRLMFDTKRKRKIYFVIEYYQLINNKLMN